MKLTRAGIFFFSLVTIGIILPMVVISQTNGTYWRNFKMTVPDEVSIKPGEEVTINASILNTGRFWLRDFNITLQGLPSDFTFKVTPSHWDELTILRDWNPKDGVFKVPESFLITIKAPDTASGLYAVTVNGTEYASDYKVSNTTKFVLKIVGAPAKPEISDLAIPQTITTGQSFDVTYRIANTASGELQATAKLLVPENWTVNPLTTSVDVKTNESAVVNFSVISQDNIGTVTALVEYTYQNQTLNVTKESTTIIPIGIVSPETGILGSIIGMFAGIQTYSPLLMTIIVVIILVIGWIAWSLYGMYGKKGKSSTKQVEEISAPPVAQ